MDASFPFFPMRLRMSNPAPPPRYNTEASRRGEMDVSRIFEKGMDRAKRAAERIAQTKGIKKL